MTEQIEQERLKDFEVDNYETIKWPGWSYWKSEHPKSFKAVLIDPNGLDNTIEQVVERIKAYETHKNPAGWSHFSTFDNTTRIVGEEVDMENNVAAFVLSRRDEKPYGSLSTSDRLAWRNHGIYGIRIQDNKLKGKLIDLGQVVNKESGLGPVTCHLSYHNRFSLDEIRDGILKYIQHFRTEPQEHVGYIGGNSAFIYTGTKQDGHEFDLRGV